MRVTDLPGYARLSEPELLFSPARPDERSAHPLRGLAEYGPFSRGLLNSAPDPIRAAIITPHGEARTVELLLCELEHRLTPQERKRYLIDFPGFARVFGTRIVVAPEAVFDLPADLDRRVEQAPAPQPLLADAVMRAVNQAELMRTEFDVLLIRLPQRWSRAFEGGEADDFDLHDFIKATTASRNLSTQILREDKVFAYPCRASVAWRLGIAIYAKAGGIPWTLADADVDTAFVGLSYAVRSSRENARRFVTCCSQVFDADGTGPEFIAYETDDVRVDRENPFLSRAEMRRVMSRSLSLYQRRHAGKAPRRIVVHKSTEFKRDEVDGCLEAFEAVDAVELVQVQEDTPWRGILVDGPRVPGGKGEPAAYPCPRGSTAALGGRDALVWTQGNVSSIVQGGGNFYKEGKGIPRPLLLTRFAGHGGWEEPARDVLQLSKMDWNSDSLYHRKPITLRYAHRLAETVKRMPALSPRPYPFRLFM